MFRTFITIGIADLTKKFGSEEIPQKNMANKIWFSMTSPMIVESWGRPEDNNRSVGPRRTALCII
jgi:hypothetical protein